MKPCIDEFNVGDVITAYHSGYHVVTKIQPRGRTSDLLYYVQIANSAGDRIKGKRERSCDAGYCKKVTHQSLVDQIDAKQATLDKMRANYVALTQEFHFDLE
jgi:hypothetical protein